MSSIETLIFIYIVDNLYYFSTFNYVNPSNALPKSVVIA